MDEWIDRSLGAMGFATTTMLGKNKQVTEVLHYVDGEGQTLDGNFILTIGKKAVILTRDRKPFIVKRWAAQKISGTNHLFPMLSVPDRKNGSRYKDSDGWIWDIFLTRSGNWVDVMVDDDMLFRVEF